MVAGTLFTYGESFRGYKCRIASAYANNDLKVVEINANDKSAKHVPNYISNDKKVKLFEDIAIAYYLTSDQLRGTNLEDQSSVLQWLSYGSNELGSAVASWVYPSLSLVESTAGQIAKAEADLKECLTFLDAHLKTRTFLVSERITLADISLAADLALALKHVADADFRAPFVNVIRWWTTIVNQENFKKVTGEITLCSKPAKFCANRFSEYKSKQVVKPAAVEKKPKAEKPKEDPKPKVAEKQAQAEEEEETYDEPKNDPFAALPKGTFNMDEFKRTYSNNDTLTVAMPYLFKNFEKEFYSVWLCEYKYANELTQTFMTSNLIGGMFQRIEKLRKNAFGSMIVWGENNNNTIAGIWFWRGQELCFPLCQDWTTDYESYEWRKMNIDDENDRKLISQFFAWEGEYKGKKI
jgi:elongation factor 1-gamma